jgi:hypothetical protein
MKWSFNLDIISAIILFILTVVVITLQILYSGPNTTKLETSLFSILQFILSLAFSWLIARISLLGEFRKSQKSFAVAAFRRILEINSAIERLLSRVSIRKGFKTETKQELDIIYEIGLGIRESINSSISDWRDIIGDEIETVTRIRELQEQKRIQNREEYLENRFEQINEEINVLKSSLPASLRGTTDTRLNVDFYEKLANAYIILSNDLEELGYISLGGHCDEDFETKIANYAIADRFTVHLGNVGERRMALIAFDSENIPVGVILNRFSEFATYHEATSLLLNLIGKAEFEVELMSISKRIWPPTGEILYDFSTKLQVDELVVPYLFQNANESREEDA